jgi:predicted DNA-binding transcriptional regulator YafY
MSPFLEFPVNRTERLYAIVEQLRAASEHPVSSTRLAADFEVTARTIKRDISALQQAGVPIWTSNGPGGGYVLNSSATLPPIAFTTSEVLALAVALAVGGGLPFEPQGRTALKKILATMDQSTRQRFEEEADRVYVRDIQVEPSTRAMQVVGDAVRTGRVVNIDYVDGQGELTRRAIEPMAMGRDRDRWLVFAWCRLRHDGRVFRLDRIQDARLTKETAPPRDLGELFGEIPADVIPVHLS